MGRHEAFEIFKTEHEDNITLEDNKVILKQRFAEAKELGVQVNQAKSRVNELKKQLDTRRMQMAAQGVLGNQPSTESDPVEERLRNQIEEEKKQYKSTFERLKGLKTEIDHLQHLHQRSKIKLQKDFQDWWTQEAARLQQDQRSESTGTGRSQDGSPSPPSSSSLHDRHIDNQDRARRQQPTPPTKELRALSSTGPSSTSIPLTGDQQTDADILAFIKARQNLLTRTGISFPH
ncbi:hypothetical protein QTP86_018277 [Hemibagrus guttatus]|nr:hypothetical protein QTP86_018277 [Hemibagrus guttatus]